VPDVIDRLSGLGSRTAYVKPFLRDKLLDHKAYIEKHGVITYDRELIKTGLSGNALGECKALEEVEHIVERLEQVFSCQE